MMFQLEHTHTQGTNPGRKRRSKKRTHTRLEGRKESRSNLTFCFSLFETVSVSSFLIRLSTSPDIVLLTVFSFSIYRHHHQEQFFTSSPLFSPIFSNLHTMKQETGIITWSSNYKWERGRGTSWWDWSSSPIHSSLAPSFLPLFNSLSLSLKNSFPAKVLLLFPSILSAQTLICEQLNRKFHFQSLLPKSFRSRREEKKENKRRNKERWAENGIERGRRNS